MKVLVVGAGSIGRRHLGNLRHGGRAGELLCTDADPARAEAAAGLHQARAVASLDEALAERPDAAIVCSPTHLHLPHALAAVRAGCHVLIEKPLAASQQGVDELTAEVARRGTIAMVGCNLRFDEVYRRVRALLDEGALGRVHSAELHFGYDLRRWRPGVDYRGLYAAHRAQGGGILLDAIHEIDLALWLFGEPRRVLSLPRRTGALEGDVEDVADLILDFRSGVGCTVHVDYLEPVYRRTIAVAGDRALVEGDFAARTVTVRTAEGAVLREEVEPPPGDRNVMYVRELDHFLDALEGKARPIAPLADGVRALEVALAARDRAPEARVARPGPRLAKVSAVIQARMGSSRLPGKVLLHAAGKSMLAHQVERLARARLVDRIVLATSEAPADRALIEEAERLGLPWFVGSEHDVLARFVGAVRKYDLGAVARITADCPLMDGDAFDQVASYFLEHDPDYVSNALPVRFAPDGFDVEILRRDALERADREATAQADREHVTRFLYTHPERFEIGLAAPFDRELASRRWTLDTRADYEFLRGVFEALYPHKPDFRLADILDLLARRPELDTVPRYVL